MAADSNLTLRALQLIAMSDAGLFKHIGINIIYSALSISKCLFEGEILITQIDSIVLKGMQYKQQATGGTFLFPLLS